jgi:hypothetical protein
LNFFWLESEPGKLDFCGGWTAEGMYPIEVAFLNW